MSHRGRFIVFEGGEGSGKSTQAAILATEIGAELTREPGGTPLGEAIRPLLLAHTAGPVDARAELLLMAAARAQHCAERIEPALAAGRDVVCDRFSGSSIAYQGYGRGLPIEDVIIACELATNGLRPDLTVLLDLAPELGRLRRGAKGDAIEEAGRAFHERVRQGFLAVAASEPARWVVIDASSSVDDVAHAVRQAWVAFVGDGPERVRP